ncbi:MAG: dUTP diphosphatase [Oscillospiraceae bacterium]|nr:dUTP diphosphatase [Oscillospiraceae bacterium]
MNIKVKILRENAQLPFRATTGSAGADLRACLDGDITLKGNSQLIIPTGIAVEIPQGYGGFVFIRSSVGKRGVALANGVGVIDSDYRGEVGVSLINHGTADFVIKNGDRLAQLVIMPVCAAEFALEDGLSETSRGAGGFGSTGRL